MTGDLDGLVALVTGAGGGGGGTVTAGLLRRCGAAVTANVRTTGPLSADVSEQLTGCRRQVGDVACERDAAELVAAATVDGRLDVLVHNAAPSWPAASLEQLSTRQWRAEMAVIVDAAFFLCRAALPLMRGHGFGRIVLVSSSAALRGGRGRSAGYAAAKAALHGLAVQIALESGPYGVTANVVAPSQLDTARVRRDNRRTPDSLARYAASVPVQRTGRADDLAGVVAFLAGRSCGYLTGQVVRLDGGSALAHPDTTPPVPRSPRSDRTDSRGPLRLHEDG